MGNFFKNFGVYLAWLVALVATGGSLYFSEALHYIPCQLCWYQRIFMYPLVFILGIASFRHDHRISIYTLPLSVMGAALALFHYLEQKVPGFGFPELCKVGVPCSASYINWAGFITIPMLSLIAFVLIVICLLASKRQPEQSSIDE